MRKISIPALGAFLALSLGVSSITAQDSTPTGEPGVSDEGISVEFIGFGETGPLPSGPAYIQLFRIIIEPGGNVDLPEYPSTALASIESGAVTLSVDAPITVVTVPDDGELDPDDQEIFPAGEEFTLEEGDSALFPPNVQGDARNDGNQDASIFVANVFPLADGDLSEDNVSTPVT